MVIYCVACVHVSTFFLTKRWTTCKTSIIMYLFDFYVYIVLMMSAVQILTSKKTVQICVLALLCVHMYALSHINPYTSCDGDCLEFMVYTTMCVEICSVILILWSLFCANIARYLNFISGIILWLPCMGLGYYTCPHGEGDLLAECLAGIIIVSAISVFSKKRNGAVYALIFFTCFWFKADIIRLLPIQCNLV